MALCSQCLRTEHGARDYLHGDPFALIFLTCLSVREIIHSPSLFVGSFTSSYHLRPPHSPKGGKVNSVSSQYTEEHDSENKFSALPNLTLSIISGRVKKLKEKTVSHSLNPDSFSGARGFFAF